MIHSPYHAPYHLYRCALPYIFFVHGAALQPQKGSAQMDQQQGTSSFMLQLVQHMLEETQINGEADL
jgi:hypothetical protein